MSSYVRSIGASLALALVMGSITSTHTSAQESFAADGAADDGSFATYSAQAALHGPSVPSSCSAKPQRTQKYQQGLTKGTQKADELFASAEIAKNPQKLQNKINRVLERLFDNVREAWRAEAKDNKRCRVQGVADGFIARIVELLGQCILDGAQWGQFAANTYCALSIELGGLGDTGVFMRAPAGLCGALFQASCDGVYSFVASEGKTKLPPAVARFCSDRGLNITSYPGCFPYTTATFADTFNNSRSTDCTY